MAEKNVSFTLKTCVLLLSHLWVYAAAGGSGTGMVGAICPSVDTCAKQGRSKCVDPSVGCGPCISRYFVEDGNTCRRHTKEGERVGSNEWEGIPEIDVLVRRVEQTRRSDGGSTAGSTATKGEVVVDKTETRIKTDHQVVQPNGETTHLEHENVDTVEKTKPAPQQPAAASETREVVPAGDDPAPAGDPSSAAGGAAAGAVAAGAAVAAQKADPVEADSDLSEINKQMEEPIAHNGEILLEDWQFILIVCGCVAVGVLGIAVAFLCWYKIQTTAKAQSEAEYPAYGLTGPSAHMPSNMSNGDRKLAQSAQMYHYQHQKQQMIAMEKREKGEMQHDASDYDSEEENEDGDLTVYECPGLAPTGEMQVKNPLFTEDRHSEATPATEEKQ